MSVLRVESTLEKKMMVIYIYMFCIYGNGAHSAFMIIRTCFFPIKDNGVKIDLRFKVGLPDVFSCLRLIHLYIGVLLLFYHVN